MMVSSSVRRFLKKVGEYFRDAIDFALIQTLQDLLPQFRGDVREEKNQILVLQYQWFFLIHILY